MAKNKEVPKSERYSSGVPSPEALDELHNSPNLAPTIHAQPAKGEMDITIKIVHNPLYF